MKKIINNKYFPYILMALLTIVICLPIFTINLSMRNEALLHMSRILAIDEVIKDGIFPPIINYKFMEGFGYALNLFYGPITTYVPIILLNIFKTAGLAFKFFTILTVILSAITMYKFTYNITKRKTISLIASLIYISVPYKLSDIYSRNAIGEYTAFVFIPIFFEGLYNLINQDKKKHYLITIGTIGLVLSHTITTIYIALFAIIYIILNIKKLKDIEIWKKGIINIVISFLICSFYAIPLLEHTFGADYTLYFQDMMKTSSENVSATALELKDLLGSELGQQEIRFSIGIVVLILSLITPFCYKKIKKEQKEIYMNFLILAILTLFMSTKLFPWTIMPSFLTVIQFAWRNLGFFAFFISFICSINAVVFSEKVLKKEILKETFLFGVIVSIFVFAFLGVFRNWKFEDTSQEKKLDEIIQQSTKIGVFSINREYMPLKAMSNIDYIENREDKSYILNGKATVISEEKNKLTYEIILEDVENNTIIELPYLYYLGYNAKISYNEEEDKNINLEESENGFLSVSLSECKNATLKITYQGTNLEKASYIISIFGIIIFVIYIIKSRKEKTDEREK